MQIKEKFEKILNLLENLKIMSFSLIYIKHMKIILK